MTLLLKILFWFSVFIIFWANVGYQVSIVILGKILTRKNKKNKNYLPSVTVMVVAHNEEKVILEKLKNLENIDYPNEKIKVLIASDNSTDRTNEIVEKYINSNPQRDVTLYKAKKRMGKTNAQNEAQKIVSSEFLVMTDANSMLDESSIKELMSSFSEPDISYVAGKLLYTNSDNSDTSSNESIYWNLDLKIREIESNIQTITAGNGALYAVRNTQYVDFNPIESHDSSMPIYYAINNQRAIANHEAIAYEKAGENTNDEFSRKVRMNRVLLSHIMPSLKILNVFKYKWFTYFYLGHRSSRYLLWFAHALLLFSNVSLAINHALYAWILLLHILILVMGVVQHVVSTKSIILNLIYYYLMTIVAQYKGIWKVLSGESKPFWEKAESTR